MDELSLLASVTVTPETSGQEAATQVNYFHKWIEFVPTTWKFAGQCYNRWAIGEGIITQLI